MAIAAGVFGRGRLAFLFASLGCVAWVLSGAHAQSNAPNSNLNVAIAFPPDDVFIRFGIPLEIRAVASATIGEIAQVQLFDEFVTEFATGTNLIDTITSPPWR